MGPVKAKRVRYIFCRLDPSEGLPPVSYCEVIYEGYHGQNPLNQVDLGGRNTIV